MQDFLIVNTVASWAAIIMTMLLNLALVRRFNDITTANLQSEQSNVTGQEQANVLTKELTTQTEQVVQTDFLPIGTTAPSFRAQTLDGIEVTNSTYYGKISVFIFVVNSPSSHEFVNRLNAEIQFEINALDLSYTVVGVNSVEDTQKFVAATQTPFSTIAADRTSNRFSKDFKVWSTPLTYVLDKEGKIKWAGQPSLEKINQLLTEWMI